MAARDYPIRFTPKGLSDAYDATDTFAGACKTLQNLVFDQSNPELVVARPGVGSPLATLSVSLNTPTFVSVFVAIGNIIYGMATTAANPGFDQPFCFNITSGLFIAVTGFTNANTPASVSSAGDWTPPTMAVIGSKLIVTHPGFSGTGANFMGVIDISNPLAPSWSSTNTTTNLLPSVPTAVVNFNNRAYFACGNVLYYSDVLVPTKMTNAGQSLTVGDSTNITAISGLPVQTSTAGVVSALIVFKAFQIWQVTGDAAIANTLSQNFLSLNIGCTAPRTIVQTPIGTLFIGIDGPYAVLPLGQVIPLTKDASKPVQDVQGPFQAIITPSRATAAFSGSIYRVCIDTVNNGITVQADYWFDITSRRWTGPHTFPYDAIAQVGNYFVISSRYVGAYLFASAYLPSTTSVYTDNGSQITCILESAKLPKTENINVKQVIETTLELGSRGLNQTYLIDAFDESNNIIGEAIVSFNVNTAFWGAGPTWASGVIWYPTYNSPVTFPANWTAPLVFKKLSIRVTANANNALSMGTMFSKYQDTGYTTL